MMSQNFDWIKHNQSEANIVFAIPVKSSFQAVNLPSFLAFTAPISGQMWIFATIVNSHFGAADLPIYHIFSSC